MSKVIPQRELRNQNASIVSAVAEGERFVITRHGAPVAELVPLQRDRRAFVPKADLVASLAATPHIDAVRFRGDLDRVAAQRI